MTFLQLLHKPEYVWALEEINRLKTGPTGRYTSLDHIDTEPKSMGDLVNDLIAHTMLTRHHQVVADINHYINTNTWTKPLKLFT